MIQGVVVLALLLQGAPTPPRVRFLTPFAVFVMDNEPLSYRVQVDPRPAHRVLVVSAWDGGDDAARASVVQLDGDEAARTHRINWYPFPAGEYEIRATVFGASGELGRVTIPLRVRARWKPEPD